jgi:hypothetical protein
MHIPHLSGYNTETYATDFLTYEFTEQAYSLNMMCKGEQAKISPKNLKLRVIINLTIN